MPRRVKKILSWISSHDLYWENKIRRQAIKVASMSALCQKSIQRFSQARRKTKTKAIISKLTRHILKQMKTSRKMSCNMNR